MISDESRRKLHELSLESFIEALDHQELNIREYSSMTFDQRLDLVIDDCYTSKNNDRAKRLIRYAKLRYPNADIHSIYYDDRDPDKNQIMDNIVYIKYFFFIYNSQKTTEPIIKYKLRS